MRPASAGENLNRGAGTNRSRPIDLSARQVSGVIKRPGVVEIANRPYTCLELDPLTVTQLGWRFALSNGKADSRTRFRGELHRKLVASLIKDRRVYHAPAEDQGLLRAGVNARSWSGEVR